jgi:hypothetical protein
VILQQRTPYLFFFLTALAVSRRPAFTAAFDSPAIAVERSLGILRRTPGPA